MNQMCFCSGPDATGKCRCQRDKERHNRTIDTLNNLIDHECEDKPMKAKLLERMKKRLEELYNE